MVMFRTVLAGAVALAIVGGVQAQTTQAPPDAPQSEPPPGAPAPGSPAGAMQPTPGGAMQPPPPAAARPMNMPSQAAIRDARRACRDAASAQRLQGRDFDRSVQSCFAQKFPDVAAHQRDCRRQGLGQGLRDDDLRAFVSSCMKG
jgi:hypothetical protein